MAQVRGRLLSLGFTDQEIEKAVATAEAAGLLDDEIFTKIWVEDQLLHHPLSRRAIGQELADKGIDKGTADAALEKLYPAEKRRNLRWAWRKHDLQGMNRSIDPSECNEQSRF